MILTLRARRRGQFRVEGAGLIQRERQILIAEITGFRPVGLQPEAETSRVIPEERFLSRQHPELEELQQPCAIDPSGGANTSSRAGGW